MNFFQTEVQQQKIPTCFINIVEHMLNFVLVGLCCQINVKMIFVGPWNLVSHSVKMTQLIEAGIISTFRNYLATT